MGIHSHAIYHFIVLKLNTYHLFYRLIIKEIFLKYNSVRYQYGYIIHTITKYNTFA